MNSYKLSLHSHTSDFANFIGQTPDKEKYVENLLTVLFKKSPTIVLGISNVNGDQRYEKFLQATTELPNKYSVNSTHKDYFFSISMNDKRVYFVKTDEIGTNKGHILIVGFKGKIKNRKLDSLLKEAHKQKCIIIAPHPLHDFDISFFLFRKIFPSGKESISRKDLKKHKKDFDALELNSYFPEDWKKIKKFAKKNKLTIESDSDAHNLNEVFRSYFELTNLNFQNPVKFKRSLKKGFKKGVKLHALDHGHTAVYRHGLNVMFRIIGKKIGLISSS